MTQRALQSWIQQLQKQNPQFAEKYLEMREQTLKDGAIPAKYKILMTLIVDAIAAHPNGCAGIANRARAAGASEAEINEAIEVAFMYGGTPALNMAVNAYRTDV
jgi:alkylhydroperoxidase/carboxymuconolactone decarboxylase family protein YurZ